MGIETKEKLEVEEEASALGVLESEIVVMALSWDPDICSGFSGGGDMMLWIGKICTFSCCDVQRKVI